MGIVARGSGRHRTAGCDRAIRRFDGLSAEEEAAVERAISPTNVPAGACMRRFRPVVNDDAAALRGWLLRVGFSENLLTQGPH
jgi:hypothetical protein